MEMDALCTPAQPLNSPFYACEIISSTVSFPRCAGVGTSSVVPAVWIASPRGCNNVVDSNQYSAPGEE